MRQDAVLAVFTLGLLLGGTVSGLALWSLSGLASPLPPPARTPVILAVAAAGVARELGVLSLPLPQNARQIPQEVLRVHLWRGVLQFGFELGTGVRTYVPSSAPYVLALALLLARAPLTAAVLTGAAFGAGRALSAALTYLARDPARAAAVAARIPHIRVIAVSASLAAFSLLFM
ncbi:hypothetical protein [Actinomadura sp. NEAU-AAG7]|uniref:hypothetical protein n=1 Tax=Actinomadura sp. NEAU-AAG7 TaxID=2839640 RepID=UPI001BE49F1A|nr:hypothetical protein [Actinomadura sp. NEAU-AAG7]MBT2211156.1 hypothetical protein [Actinomadura sp. NEAU-AAG7]